MATKKALDKMSLEELEEARLELMAERDGVIADLKDVTRRRDEVYELQQATIVVDAMNDAQKEALRTVLAPVSVENQNTVSGSANIERK